MDSHNSTYGHFYAIMTIFIWGTTFVSTKLLLIDFSPLEILFLRFTLGLAALYAINTHKLILKEAKHLFYIIAAGLCGITLYFLLENIALTYTTAANVGIIVTVAPILTALFSQIIFKEDKLTTTFFIGFILAISGVFIISFKDVSVTINPTGDILAFLASCVWAVYSILCKKIASFGYNTIQTTRDSFLYGIILMIPAIYISPISFTADKILDPVNAFNLLYLGLGASAMCFVTWNIAVKILGPLKTSAYIYAVPVVTITTSYIFLSEKITFTTVSGTVLILLGLLLSENKLKLKSTAIAK